MVTLTQLRDFKELKKQEYPNLAEEFDDLFQLCLDEIDQGESMMNEILICHDAINDLILDENQRTNT